MAVRRGRCCAMSVPCPCQNTVIRHCHCRPNVNPSNTPAPVQFMSSVVADSPLCAFIGREVTARQTEYCDITLVKTLIDSDVS